jgi:hypothetical protein
MYRDPIIKYYQVDIDISHFIIPIVFGQMKIGEDKATELRNYVNLNIRKKKLYVDEINDFDINKENNLMFIEFNGDDQNIAEHQADQMKHGGKSVEEPGAAFIKCKVDLQSGSIVEIASEEVA